MRFLYLAAALGMLATTAVHAQSFPAPAPRFEAGIATLFGVDPLVGGTFAVRILERPRVRLAVEAGAYLPLFGQREWACVNSSASGCRNGEPFPAARALGTAGLRATVPIASRWYALAEGAFAQGEWQYPTRGKVLRAASGLGVGRVSRSGARSLELRWQRIGTTGDAATAWRFGWSYRW